MYHLWGTTFWGRKTMPLWPRKGLPVTKCSCWYRGLANWYASCGIHATSRLMSAPTKCCRLWFCAVKRSFRSHIKVRLGSLCEWSEVLWSCLLYRSSPRIEVEHVQNSSVLLRKMNLVCRKVSLRHFGFWQGDCVDFMSWFLNTLHSSLGGGKKISSSIISKTFRGTMKVYSKKMPPIDMVSRETHVYQGFPITWC